LSLYSSTSLNEALKLPVSTATHFFESKAFKDWRKVQDSKAKTQVAIVERLNGVITAVGSVAKIIAKIR
jgi:hypothetical protein